MKYKAVLFDMDDTLLKSWEVKWAHHRMVAKKYYNIDLTEEKLGKHWGEPFPVLVKSLYGQPEPIEKMMERFVLHEPEFLKIAHDSAVEALETLNASGVVLGVVTMMITPVAEEDMRREFPTVRFALIQGADQTLVHKPDPLVFEPAFKRLEQLGIIDKKKVLYVGDALNDFYAARDAGLDFVGVTTGFVDQASFKKAGATQVVTSLAELSNLVLRKVQK